MSLKKVVFASIFLCLFVGVVFADWEDDMGLGCGSWLIKEREHFSGDTSDDWGQMRWKYEGFENFCGYECRINFSEFQSERTVFPFQSAEMYVHFIWNFSSANDGTWIYLRLSFMHYQRLWGIDQNFVVGGSIVACNMSEEIYVLSGKPFGLYPWDYAEVLLWRNGTELFVRCFDYCYSYANKPLAIGPLLFYFDDPDYPFVLYDYFDCFSLAPAWFDNVTVTLTIKHIGSGCFEGFLHDDLKSEVFSPELPVVVSVFESWGWDLIEAIRGFGAKVLPDEVGRYVVDFANWAGPLYGVLVPLLGGAALFQ